MTRQFRYIGPSVSHSTVQELERLRQQADDGEVIGLAHVVLYRNREWSSGTTGEATRNKLLTVGLLVIEAVSLVLDIVEWRTRDRQS